MKGKAHSFIIVQSQKNCKNSKKNNSKKKGYKKHVGGDDGFLDGFEWKM